MKKTKKIFKIIPLLVMFAVGLLIYSFYIEPKMLVVKNVKVFNKNYNTNKKLKIIQFTDVHLIGDYTNKGYKIDDFSKLVDKINKENADFVLFTGDLIDKIYMYDNLPEVSSELLRIKSKYGNYAVWGNHDYGGGGRRSYIDGVDYSKKTVFENILSEGGFTLLVNESAIISTHVGSVVLTGLDDAIFGNIDYKNIYNSKELYHIVMAHEPDVYDEISENNINLFLSGHTHGGQVRLPGVGAIITPPYGRKYIYGIYDRNDTKIYVSSGIGTTHLPIRLFNPPSFTVFEIDM